MQIAKLIENNILFMLLDMSRINFIDSSGLDAVMAVRKLVTNGGGIIACAALNDNVLKVFRVTWADQKISITTTRPDGLRMIQELRTAQA